MNPTLILALISDLYGQIANLQQDNQRLTRELESSRVTVPGGVEQAPPAAPPATDSTPAGTLS